jgi:hypothetical protein
MPDRLPDYAATITDCPRCAGRHADLTFKPLTRATQLDEQRVVTHWTICPTLGEPIFATTDYRRHAANDKGTAITTSEPTSEVFDSSQQVRTESPTAGGEAAANVGAAATTPAEVG